MNYTVRNDKIIAPLEHRDSDGRYNQPLAESVANKGPVITITSAGHSLFHYITAESHIPSVTFSIGTRTPDHEEISDRISKTQDWFSSELLRVRKLFEDLETIADYRKRIGGSDE